MAHLTPAQLQAIAEQIRIETVEEANDAERIGDAFKEILNYLLEVTPDVTIQLISSIISSEVTARNAAIEALKEQLINGAPGALDAFNELATALGNDPQFATTIFTQLAAKASKLTLVAISATEPAPQVYETGDKYYNSATKKISEVDVTGDNWINPVTPQAGTLYIFESTNYLWNGIELFEVGKLQLKTVNGSSLIGSGNLIIEGGGSYTSTLIGINDEFGYPTPSATNWIDMITIGNYEFYDSALSTNRPPNLPVPGAGIVTSYKVSVWGTNADPIAFIAWNNKIWWGKALEVFDRTNYPDLFIIDFDSVTEAQYAFMDESGNNITETYAERINLLTYVDPPLAASVGQKYYSQVDKKIHTCTVSSPLTWDAGAFASSGVIYKSEGLYLNWNGGDLVPIGATVRPIYSDTEIQLSSTVFTVGSGMWTFSMDCSKSINTLIFDPTSTGDLSISNFESLPTSNSSRLLIVINNRSSALVNTPRTTDLVDGGITYIFVNMDSATTSLPSGKSYEMSFLFIFTDSTHCIVRMSSKVQA